LLECLESHRHKEVNKICVSFALSLQSHRSAMVNDWRTFKHSIAKHISYNRPTLFHHENYRPKLVELL